MFYIRILISLSACKFDAPSTLQGAMPQNTMTTAASTTFYKLDIQGIVYLVDPATSIAHTYDLEAPTPIGAVNWTDLTKPPQITLYEAWQAILTEKRAAKLIAVDPTPTAAP